MLPNYNNQLRGRILNILLKILYEEKQILILKGFFALRYIPYIAGKTETWIPGQLVYQVTKCKITSVPHFPPNSRDSSP